MEPVTMNDSEKFSLIKRAKSFTHAWRGIVIFIQTTHNAWIHLFIFVPAIAFGTYFHITHTEWMILVLVGGFVLTAEAFNTAIEIDINLTSPEYHPHARDTKDVAAGAVLIASITATVVGILIFGRYIFQFSTL